MSAKTASTQFATALVISANGATADAGHSPNIPTEQHAEANLYINVTAAGTTVTPVIEVSPDNGTTWFTHTTLAAITTTGNTLAKLTAIGRLMRVNWTAVTGSFTVNAWLECKRTDG